MKNKNKLSCHPQYVLDARAQPGKFPICEVSENGRPAACPNNQPSKTCCCAQTIKGKNCPQHHKRNKL